MPVCALSLEDETLSGAHQSYRERSTLVIRGANELDKMDFISVGYGNGLGNT